MFFIYHKSVKFLKGTADRKITMIISGTEIRKAYNRQLNKIAQMPEMSAALAVLLLSNMGICGVKVALAFFDRVKFDFSRISIEHLKILCDMLQKVDRKTRELTLDPPQRVGIGGFMLQFNEIRGYRPLTTQVDENAKIDEPFDPEGFSYLKTDPAERFHRAQIGDMGFDFLFNLFPFAPFHFVFVPEREKQHRQFLSNDNDFARRVLTNAWMLIMGSRDRNIRLSFNALGAHATANHFHFQGFFVDREWQLPIDAFLKEYGSLAGWHVRHAVWLPASTPNLIEQTLLHIQQMHKLYWKAEEEKKPEEKVSFNLYMSPRGVAILPRRHQGAAPYLAQIQSAGFTTGFAFYELTGEIICPDQGSFKEFLQGKKDSKHIQEIFDALSLDANPFGGI